MRYALHKQLVKVLCFYFGVMILCIGGSKD